MEEQISKILKTNAEQIEISENFKQYSLQRILNSKNNLDVSEKAYTQKPRLIFSPFAIGFAAFLIVGLGTFSYIKLFTGGNTTSRETLQAEAKNLEFRIELKDAQYFSESAAEVASILDKIDDTKNTQPEQETWN
ncbi:MAG: hypothetical protein COU07_03990 [Candidatus Harrisonbacteria bacterium CG10_big_fil_rev_8_21_14_0_10_40_38]|uniref:Uncharacterized protein n=1 Tax=Candidatus Harrisonbacteria bacterium CG10_big_fil_rev_8_21_14_0_10_40_38 TaxID=1974583 RepID=A0A2H0URG6_9BACT|nr:MAG: hypothetical protein COU07_03990 [Candidatus Harrisonbacteria bacterium CG10_big_fil_rev_8_21_14_0_10_40_38]